MARGRDLLKSAPDHGGYNERQGPGCHRHRRRIGIGRRHGVALAAAGAKVAIFDLQDELGEKKAKEIGGLYVKTNVADAANTEASVKTVVEKLGAPRVVVNCAGIGRAARTISKSGPHDLGMFAQVIQVNLIGTFNVIRLAAGR